MIAHDARLKEDIQYVLRVFFAPLLPARVLSGAPVEQQSGRSTSPHFWFCRGSTRFLAVRTLPAQSGAVLITSAESGKRSHAGRSRPSGHQSHVL